MNMILVLILQLSKFRLIDKFKRSICHSLTWDHKTRSACTSGKHLNFFSNSQQKAVESCWLFSLELFFCWEFSIQISEVNKFLSSFPVFWARNFTCAPDRTRKTVSSILKCTPNRDTTRNIAFCSLLPSFLMCFNQKFSQWGFFSPNVVLRSEIRCSSKKDFHDSNSSV